MAEQAPAEELTIEKKPAHHSRKGEHGKHAKRKHRSKHAEWKHAQETAFGKHDKDVTPAVGELTYEQYLAEREKVYQKENPDQKPEDRIIHIGKEYRTVNGKFASEEAYRAQFARIEEQSAGGEYQPPELEEFGYMELVKEAADAEELGDKAYRKQIQDVIEHMLTVDAMSDDTENPEDAQHRYENQLNHFEMTVAKLIDIRKIHEHAEKKKDVGNLAIVSSFANLDKGDGNLIFDANIEDTEEPEVSEEPEVAEPEAVEDEPTVELEKVILNGEKGTIQQVFRNGSGKEVFEVEFENGETRLVHADTDGLERVALEVKKDKPSAKKIKVEVAPEPAEEVDAEEAPAVDVEVQAETEATPKEVEATPEEKAQTEAEKREYLERVKVWFQKERVLYQHFGGKAYWGEKWSRSEQGARDLILGISVKEGMSPDEIEHIQKRNRAVAWFGAGALATVGLFMLWKTGQSIGASMSDSSPDTTAITDLNSTPTPESAPVVTPVTAPEVTPISDVPTGPEAVGSYPLEAFDVPRGMGGEELFSKLGMNPREWYAHEEELLKNFPKDFYRMGSEHGGHVGIAHSGWLSPEAQEYIRALT